MVARARTDLHPEPMRRGGGLRRLPDLLGRLLDPAARRRGLAEARLLTDWAAVVGPQLASRCQPVKLTRSGGDGAVLVLHVSGPAALELQHSHPQVIERINDYFGYPAIDRLRLIQAPLRRPVKTRARRPAGRTLEARECAELEAMVRPIDDAALREALARLGRTMRSTAAP